VNKVKKAINGLRKMSLPRKGAAVGGAVVGMGIGKGFPDIDIKLFGIGGHRHWSTHSVLTSLLLYKTVKWYQKKLMSDKSGEFQKKSLKYIGAPMLAAFSAANAVHLFADMLGAKDVVGWPIGVLLRGGMWKDRIWLGANGIGCLVLAWKFMKITISNEDEEISTGVTK